MGKPGAKYHDIKMPVYVTEHARQRYRERSFGGELLCTEDIDQRICEIVYEGVTDDYFPVSDDTESAFVFRWKQEFVIVRYFQGCALAVTYLGCKDRIAWERDQARREKQRRR